MKRIERGAHVARPLHYCSLLSRCILIVGIGGNGLSGGGPGLGGKQVEAFLEGIVGILYVFDGFAVLMISVRVFELRVGDDVVKE